MPKITGHIKSLVNACLDHVSFRSVDKVEEILRTSALYSYSTIRTALNVLVEDGHAEKRRNLRQQSFRVFEYRWKAKEGA